MLSSLISLKLTQITWGFCNKIEDKIMIIILVSISWIKLSIQKWGSINKTMEQKGNVKNSNDDKVINVVHLIFFCILSKDLNIVGSFRYCYHFSICIVRSHLFVACMVAVLLAVAAVALIIGLVVLALVGCIRVDKKAPLFL